MRIFCYNIVLVILVNGVTASDCDKVQQKYSPEVQYVSQHEIPKNISIYWNNDPTRAAAALLAAVLRHGYGYQHVRLQQSPQNLQNIKVEPCTGEKPFKEVALIAEYESQQLLHVHLGERFRDKQECANVTQWMFYANATSLSLCGFTESSLSNAHILDVYLLDSSNKTVTKALAAYMKQILPSFHIKELNRTIFLQTLYKENSSFLFFDYDMWGEDDIGRDARGFGIRAIQVPTCTPANSLICRKSPFTSVITYVVDACLVKEYAPQIVNLVKVFKPSLDSLRIILGLEGERNIEEAACATAIQSYVKKRSLPKTYDIVALFCSDNTDLRKLYAHLGYQLSSMFKKHIKIKLNYIIANCSDADDFYNSMDQNNTPYITPRLIGMVIGNVTNITRVAKVLTGTYFPVLIYDAVGADEDSNDPTKAKVNSTASLWFSTGRLFHLTLALHHFILSMNWTRVAVITDQTLTAKRFSEDLKHLNGITLRDYSVMKGLSKLDAEEVLNKLRVDDARIILVNTNYVDAVTILSTGERLNMNVLDTYAWITREWEPNNVTFNIPHFTLTLSCHRGKDITPTAGLTNLRNDIDNIWKRWPRQVEGLLNALFTLANGFKDVFHNYPHARNDVQSNVVIELFEKSLTNGPVRSLNQNLTYKGRSIEETLVFVNEWYGYHRKFLARWRVNISSHSVYVEYVHRNAYFGQSPPNDGRYNCRIWTGDPYLPTCYDVAIWVTVALSAVLLFTLITLYIRRKKNVKGTNRFVPSCLQRKKEYNVHVKTSEQHRCSLQTNLSNVERRSKNGRVQSDFDSGFGDTLLTPTSSLTAAPAWVGKMSSSSEEQEKMLQEKI